MILSVEKGVQMYFINKMFWCWQIGWSWWGLSSSVLYIDESSSNYILALIFLDQDCVKTMTYKATSVCLHLNIVSNHKTTPTVQSYVFGTANYNTIQRNLYYLDKYVIYV